MTNLDFRPIEINDNLNFTQKFNWYSKISCDFAHCFDAIDHNSNQTEQWAIRVVFNDT